MIRNMVIGSIEKKVQKKVPIDEALKSGFLQSCSILNLAASKFSVNKINLLTSEKKNREYYKNYLNKSSYQ